MRKQQGNYNAPSSDNGKVYGGIVGGYLVDTFIAIKVYRDQLQANCPDRNLKLWRCEIDGLHLVHATLTDYTTIATRLKDDNDVKALAVKSRNGLDVLAHGLRKISLAFKGLFSSDHPPIIREITNAEDACFGRLGYPSCTAFLQELSALLQSWNLPADKNTVDSLYKASNAMGSYVWDGTRWDFASLILNVLIGAAVTGTTDSWGFGPEAPTKNPSRDCNLPNGFSATECSNPTIVENEKNLKFGRAWNIFLVPLIQVGTGWTLTTIYNSAGSLRCSAFDSRKLAIQPDCFVDSGNVILEDVGDGTQRFLTPDATYTLGYPEEATMLVSLLLIPFIADVILGLGLSFKPLDAGFVCEWSCTTTTTTTLTTTTPTTIAPPGPKYRQALPQNLDVQKSIVKEAPHETLTTIIPNAPNEALALGVNAIARENPITTNGNSPNIVVLENDNGGIIGTIPIISVFEDSLV